jgi:flagellar basal body-associated protein FliL
MANDDKLEVPDNSEQEARSDNRMMWISSIVILVIILGGMGINMFIHQDSSANPVTTSSSPD